MTIPDRYKIKYEFKHMGKGFSAPIMITADVEYVDDRLAEIKACYPSLVKKIGEINVASRNGANEFDIANSLVSYYAMSAINLNNKKECLLTGSDKRRVYSEQEAKQINSRFD